jgi:hypothetical protein
MVFGLNQALILPDQKLKIGSKILSMDHRIFMWINKNKLSGWIDIFLEYKGLNIVLPSSNYYGEYYCEHNFIKYDKYISKDGILTYENRLLCKVHPFIRSAEYMKSNKANKTGVITITI